MSHVQSDIVFLCAICGMLHHIITKCYHTKVWTVAAQQQSTKVTYRLMRAQLKPCFKTTRVYYVRGPNSISVVRSIAQDRWPHA